MFALADCNNFFVSCERAFQPELEGRAVVVLSNNDGCIVARSNESKAMGIKMGTPFFQVKSLVEQGSLVVRSSNYTLYGDLSRRVMAILGETFPKVEPYSIDEAFLPVEGIPIEKVISSSKDVICRIRRCTGIPVSIGLAPTRTLAKVANHFAKKYPAYGGVCTIDTTEKRLKALSLTPVDDVWGIGWRVAPRLQQRGIRTALDFASLPDKAVYKELGITGLRTWKELNGIPAIESEPIQRRKSICTSRSFANTTDNLGELEKKVADFAAICAAKLREEGSAAGSVQVFLLTNRFREDQKQDFATMTVDLPVECSSTKEIVDAALAALRTVYKNGYQYKKAGVTVFDIVPDDSVQGVLFGYDQKNREKQDRLSRVMDSLNSRDNQLLRLASQRKGHYADGIRRDYCSKLFSTSWKDMIEIH